MKEFDQFHYLLIYDEMEKTILSKKNNQHSGMKNQNMSFL